MKYLVSVIFCVLVCGAAFADIASTTYVSEQTAGQVKITGNQEIGGVKTYTQSPIVPTPPLP